jgi:hypothetical protein
MDESQWGRDASVLQGYDDIYASRPDFRVKEVRYLRDRARAAGSDYALVVSDVEAYTEYGRDHGTGSAALKRLVNDGNPGTGVPGPLQRTSVL